MVVRCALLSSLVLLACATEVDDGGRSDVRETTGAPASAPPPAPPPVLSAGFEPASADCNGWIAEGARSIRSVPPRSGTYACKLCADGSRDAMTIGRTVGPLEPGRYVLRAWTRKRPQNPAPAAAVATVDAATGAGPVVVTAAVPAVRDEWDRLEAVLDVPEGATSASVRIGSPLAASEECMLVDDVSIDRVP